MSKKKNNKPLVKFIPCDIYRRGVCIFVGKLNEFKKFIEKEYPKEEDAEFRNMVLQTEECSSIALQIFYDKRDATCHILIDELKYTPKYIAKLTHELLHATFFILDFCGVGYYSDTNNEPFTYMLEHLVINAVEKYGYEEVDL